MKKTLLVFISMTLLSLFPLGAFAQQAATYGAYSALSIDKAVVEDVVVEGNDIYVKVNQSFWGSEFVVKSSLRNKEAYTVWANGATEMPVKVYKSQLKNKKGYTYRIATNARFLEYWTDDKLVLHLEKKE